MLFDENRSTNEKISFKNDNSKRNFVFNSNYKMKSVYYNYCMSLSDFFLQTHMMRVEIRL